MTKFNVLLILHLLAIHSSMAAMEILSWLIFALFLIDSIRKGERPGLLGCEGWLIGFAFIAIVGLLIHADIAPVAPQVGFLRFIFLIYSLSYAWRTSSLLARPNKLVQIWMAVAALVGAYAFVQFLTGVNLARPHKLLDPTGTHGFRATGFYSMSLTLAYVLGISGAFLLPQLRVKEKRWLWAAMLALISLGLFASLSRAAWISFALICFVFAWQIVGKRAIWLLLPAGLVFLLLFVFEPEFHYRITNLFDMRQNSSSGMRRDIWMGYWQIYKDYPLLGIGLFNGDDVLPSVYERLGIQQTFVSHAHNNFLQALAGTGSFGFICFLAFQIYFLKLGWGLSRALRVSQPQMANLAQGAFLAQVFWMTGGLTECNFFDGEVNHAIVFVWALLAAIRRSAVRT